MIYKIAVIVYVILYSVIAIGVRSYILYRNTGINPLKKMGQGGIQGINERVLMFGAAIIPVIAIAYVYSSNNYSYFVPITYLEIDIVRQVGIVLMILGSVASIIAQFQMGNSWRIGINKNETTQLVTKGFYRYSRNPIYVGLIISFIGFFMILPNAITLCCLAMSVPSIAIKIRLEEAYLKEKQGETFVKYMESVNRWF